MTDCKKLYVWIAKTYMTSEIAKNYMASEIWMEKVWIGSPTGNRTPIPRVKT